MGLIKNFMKILFHLKAKELSTGEVNPKNYPFRDELYATFLGPVDSVKHYELKEITGPIPLQESKDLIDWADKIICIDSYLQHLAWYMGKQAIVLWGQSDPSIFGHPENINLLKNKKYLRERQYGLWTQTSYNKEAFVTPEIIIKTLNERERYHKNN